MLKQGFRPFFLCAGLWAVVSLGLWIAARAGSIELPTALAPRDWHIHELLFGYTSAVIGGFLLTAVANWTGRPPVSGAPLAGLAALWIAGRIAVYNSGNLEPGVAAVIDLAFLVVLSGVVARELIAADNRRNLKVLVLVAGLALVNLLFHVEAARDGVAELSVRLGIGGVLLLIMLIGGRIIPAFTGNWLRGREPGRMPMPFDRFDAFTMALSAGALVVWAGGLDDEWTAVLLLAAAVFNAGRLTRWAGQRCFPEPLVLVLHGAYAFIPLGLFVLAGATYDGEVIPADAAIHLLTAGAIGMMTIAMMTRVCLGHTGAPLRADGWIKVIYLLVLAGIVLRTLAAFMPGEDALVQLSAAAWIAGFGAFVLWFVPRTAR